MALKTDPIAYPSRGMSRDEVPRYIGVDTSKLDQLVADRRMPRSKRIDGRVVWDRFALDIAFSDLDGGGVNMIDEILAGRGK